MISKLLNLNNFVKIAASITFVFAILFSVNAQDCTFDSCETINSSLNERLAPVGSTYSNTSSSWDNTSIQDTGINQMKWTDNPDCLWSTCNTNAPQPTAAENTFKYQEEYKITCRDGTKVSVYQSCPDPVPEITINENFTEYCGNNSVYVGINYVCPNKDTKNDLKFCEASNSWVQAGTGCLSVDRWAGTPAVVQTGPTIISGYPIVIAPTIWGGSSNWGTSNNWNTGNNWTINQNPYLKQTINTVTTVIKYECPDGSLVENRSTCPAGTCANGATDYPTCRILKQCTNGTIDYPTCGNCASGYELFPAERLVSVDGSGTVTPKCVAICGQLSVRDNRTGSCTVRPCTNGGLNAPYCTACPTGKDYVSQTKQCVDSCPHNSYRTDTGCVAYRCQNGATDYPNCVSCPAPKFFQTSSNSCVACDAGTSWNGQSCIKNACVNDAMNHPDCNLCVTGMDYIAAQKKCMYPCPTGYTRASDGLRCDLINTACTNYAINSPRCDQCPTGYDYIPASRSCLQSCPTGYTRNGNNYCVIDNIQCGGGVTVSANQSCPPTMRQCDNGVMVSIYSNCPITPAPPIINNPQYKECADGQRVSINSVCPTNNNNIQYKQCTDGQRIPINNICPAVINSGSHRVSTINITGVSNMSAICNGVGNIYGGMPSYGWFEWGDNANSLKNRTPVQYIGKDQVVTYSAPMANLSASSVYYCRAVMANNNGTYRGDIVQTITSSKPVNYVKTKVETVTTVKTKAKVATKKVTVTTPVYACKDSYGNKATVKGGEKLISFSIDKSNASYTQGDKVTYTINYKNESKLAIKNIEVKVSLPKEIINIKSSKGDIKDKDIIYKIDELGPKGEGVMLIEGQVDAVENGKNLVVAGLLSYDLPSKDNLRDEVSAINVGSARSDNNGVAAATNTKAKANNNSSFLPHTLIEWSIMLLIIFAAIIAFRAWKAKREDGHH